MDIGKTRIDIVRGSVTDQKVDAIVNAANKSMRGGGGIDGRIHSLAGRELLWELENVAPHGAETGEPVVTAGHKLPHKFVIHVAGPRWHGGSRGEAELLAACYRNSLQTADERGLESIAFCSISTGVYGYPIDQAAPLALETAADFLKSHPETSLRRIIFALYGADEFAVFHRAYEHFEAQNK
jgi:O-acetyl-ADP-ribose deacetylase (regulator of RNase III)